MQLHFKTNNMVCEMTGSPLGCYVWLFINFVHEQLWLMYYYQSKSLIYVYQSIVEVAGQSTDFEDKHIAQCIVR